jgi:hypothetical protein
MTQARASLVGRIAALLAGVAILLVATVGSVGLVLLAPLGIWVTHRVQRARGRTVSLFDRWIGAVVGATIALLLVVAGFAAMIPADTWREVRHSADSASVEAQKEPPPAWLRRVVPSASQPLPRSAQPLAVSTIAMVWGVGIGVGMTGIMLGSVNWAGTMLLIFCVYGEWLPAPTAIDPNAV